MKVLVINAGSSSLKYQLIDMDNEQVICKGLCERIGVSGGISHKAADGRTYEAETAMPTHSEAFEAVVYAMTKSDAKVIDSFDEVSAIGHRIVQGGSIFKGSCIITPEALNDIDELGALAPLHNPAHVLAIKACIKTFVKLSGKPLWKTECPSYIPKRMLWQKIARNALFDRSSPSPRRLLPSFCGSAFTRKMSGKVLWTNW